MPAAEAAVEKSVLKDARSVCHKHRDEYYSCVDAVTGSKEDPGQVFAACKSQRQAFERACRASWVKHFDKLREREVQVLQVLHRNINRSAASAAGQLAGQVQKPQASGQPGSQAGKGSS